MIPIFVRGHALESFLDAFVVVPVDVCLDLVAQVLSGCEGGVVEHLGLRGSSLLTWYLKW